MKRNIPILIILAIFVVSNALLYNYLNNDFFVDKEPETELEEKEKILDKLISYQAREFQSQIEDRERRLEELRNRSLTDLTDEQKAQIEAEIRKLEDERRALAEAEEKSKEEALLAQKRLEDNELTLTELRGKVAALGKENDEINSFFDEYVTTLEDAALESSTNETEKSRVEEAFEIRRGLDFLKEQVADSQKARSELIDFYIDKLTTQSNEYKSGLLDIAGTINDSAYTPVDNSEGYIDSNPSAEDLSTRINNFLNSSLSSKEREMLDRMALELEEQSEEILSEEEIKRNKALALQEEEYLAEIERLKEELSTLTQEEIDELLAQLEDKDLTIEDLQAKLDEELAKEPETILEPRVPMPDRPLYTDWIHIPLLWISDKRNLSYTGKKIDSIAWSRVKIEDDITISFYGDFNKGGECLLVLYGNGRFKSWSDGIIISLQDVGAGRALITLTENGISDSAKILYSDSITLSGGISGSYHIQVSQGRLSLMVGGNEIIKNFPVKVNLKGPIGFGNREEISEDFKVSNLRIFKIE